ncbi:hypothetical protein GK047_08720 [Paenibacillus sp. SYP-B3998]|uniref:Nucleotidyl transferase AbiEii/AbiGii toxin family protein n=1 Tax=Paenibacillus sp. SYP-B3998 TaxID=2678564 RepID=A0A6G3ZVJ1_9BACL|nr:hypothetical protein [Paenibacillus sp. SYP-B3998]NEW06090.1 hypothetical protein [Paenibacillus sp. SYP-B3998]
MYTVLLLQPLLLTIESLHQQLQRAEGTRWLIGGSCGLLLHNVDIQRSPRDLDIYVDSIDVQTLHASLNENAIDTPVYSETPIYASILSHYDIQGNSVEVVGDFRVQAMRSTYQVEVSYLWEHHCTVVPLTPLCTVKIMPLAHELLFNLLRDRPDRYEAIAKMMKSNPSPHVPALEDLLARNSWGREILSRLERLLAS